MSGRSSLAARTYRSADSGTRSHPTPSAQFAHRTSPRGATAGSLDVADWSVWLRRSWRTVRTRSLIGAARRALLCQALRCAGIGSGGSGYGQRGCSADRLVRPFRREDAVLYCRPGLGHAVACVRSSRWCGSWSVRPAPWPRWPPRCRAERDEQWRSSRGVQSVGLSPLALASTVRKSRRTFAGSAGDPVRVVKT
jgi:hypothetical protein